MSVNIDDIKKLPDQEKLKLIDDLLDSIDKQTIDEYLNQTDDETILQERWAKYKSGDMKFDSWDNVEKRLETMQNKGSRREAMTYHIKFSEEAEIDADTAGFYYDSKVPGLSFRFFDDLHNALLSLKTNPFSFHIYHNYHPKTLQS